MMTVIATIAMTVIMIAIIKNLIRKSFMEMVMKFMMLIIIAIIQNSIKFRENGDDNEEFGPIKFHEDDDEIHNADNDSNDE